MKTAYEKIQPLTTEIPERSINLSRGHPHQRPTTKATLSRRHKLISA